MIWKGRLKAVGLLLGIYMAVNAVTKAQRGVLIQDAGKHPADCQEAAETDERGLDEKIMEPKLPDTVKEYMQWYPECPETVAEYIARGKEWAEYIDSLSKPEQESRKAIAAPDPQIEIPSPEGMTYYSQMELTAYIWTGNPCADGVYPTEGHTAACNDPGLWHKWVYIEGVGNRYVHDTGGMSSDVIDLYVGDYDTAVQFGRRSAAVYLMED